MAKKLNTNEIPIAYAMIAAAKRVRPRRDGGHPYQQYFFLWSAFVSIYEALAEGQGLKPQLKRNEDGSIITREAGNVNIPQVELIDEHEQIMLAASAFSPELRHNLITHESIHFFAHRIPYWQGKPLERDAWGQKLNGVINVKYTLDRQYPVWSPIDLQSYQDCIQNPEQSNSRDFLVGQIVDLLHTVRKNLVTIADKFDDSNDIAVVTHALPLLELIVASFTR